MAQIEIEVVYFKEGKYDSRKWAQVKADQANRMFSATVLKMESDGKEALVCLRNIIEDGSVVLLNSHHVNKYDPKGSLQPKVPAGSKK